MIMYKIPNNYRIAQWYQKPPSWGQQPLDIHKIIQLDSDQPSPDPSTRCVAMMPMSPHGRLNLVKVPCDYPFVDAGLICKKPLNQQDIATNGN